MNSEQLKQIIKLNEQIYPEVSQIVTILRETTFSHIHAHETILDKVKRYLTEKCEVIYLPIADDHFGGFMVRKANNFYCYINTHQPRGFQYFVMCHELYHLLSNGFTFQGEGITSQTAVAVELDERKANCFAALIQVDSDLLRWEFHNLKDKFGADYFGVICELMSVFETTYETILIRLYETGCMDEELLNQYFFANVDLTQLFAKYGLDQYILQPSLQTRIGNLDRVVNQAKQNNNMAEGDIADNCEYVEEIVAKLNKLYRDNIGV